MTMLRRQVWGSGKNAGGQNHQMSGPHLLLTGSGTLVSSCNSLASISSIIRISTLPANKVYMGQKT